MGLMLVRVGPAVGKKGGGLEPKKQKPSKLKPKYRMHFGRKLNMRIDNSRAKTWHKCPWMYRERYIHNIEPRNKAAFFGYGSRMHKLLEHRLLGTPAPPKPDSLDDVLEAECQSMFAAYEAHYPVEPFDVVDVERYVEVPLPRTTCGRCSSPELEPSQSYPRCLLCRACGFHSAIHIYIAKIDGIVRMRDTGMLNILEHKTEKRGGKQNLPEAWAARAQVGLYLWAVESLYGEPVDQIILDVLTRQSPAGREPPTFSRQNLQRSREQIDQALQDLVWTADKIEEMTTQFAERSSYDPWPADKEQCAPGAWKCDYYSLHIFGRSQEVLDAQYAEAEEYLSL